MIMDDELSKKLDAFKAKLVGHELHIFEKRMITDKSITLRELGKELNITPERVRQIEMRVTGRLRVFLSTP